MTFGIETPHFVVVEYVEWKSYYLTSGSDPDLMDDGYMVTCKDRSNLIGRDP